MHPRKDAPTPQEPRYWNRPLTKEEEFITPDDVVDLGWGFFHDVELVMRGFQLWRLSGWQHIPTLAEVEAYSDKWLDDLNLMYLLYERQGPDDAG